MVASEYVTKVALAFDEISLVGQCDEGVTNGGVTMRVILHGMAHYISHFDKTPIVFFFQCMQDAALDRLETIGHIGNGPFTYDIGGILKKVKVNQVSEWTVPFVDREMVVPSRVFTQDNIESGGEWLE